MMESLVAILSMGLGLVIGVTFAKMFIESELKRLGLLKDNLIVHINNLEDERLEREHSYNLSLTDEEMFLIYQLLSKDSIQNGEPAEVNTKLMSKLIQYEFEKMIG